MHDLCLILLRILAIPPLRNPKPSTIRTYRVLLAHKRCYVQKVDPINVIIVFALKVRLSIVEDFNAETPAAGFHMIARLGG